MSSHIIFFVFLFFVSTNISFAGIDFRNLKDVDAALELARTNKKLVFVDFYATWCAPCKVMDRVFEERDVAQYFNQDFISIKIDMDGSVGKSLSNKYEIVFLPTLLILDQHGNTLAKIDKLLTGQELIDRARDAARGSSKVNGSSLNQNPFPSGSNQNKIDIDPNSKEKVIYIHDTRASSCPINLI